MIASYVTLHKALSTVARTAKRPWRARGVPMPNSERIQSPRLNALAWTSSGLSTFSCPRTCTRRNPPFRTDAHTGAPAILRVCGGDVSHDSRGCGGDSLHGVAFGLLVGPRLLSATGLADVGANLQRLRIVHRRAAVVALVGDDFLDQLYLIGNGRNRSRLRLPIAMRKV
jgi:hypothetical protein